MGHIVISSVVLNQGCFPIQNAGVGYPDTKKVENHCVKKILILEIGDCCTRHYKNMQLEKMNAPKSLEFKYTRLTKI